jgi:hypothetical protein
VKDVRKKVCQEKNRWQFYRGSNKMKSIFSNLYSLLADDFQKQVIWSVISGVLGCFIGMAIQASINRSKINSKYRRVKKKIEKIEHFDEGDIGIQSLEHADPYYDIKDIDVILSGKRLYIDFPEKLKSEIKKKDTSFEFHKDTSFDGSNDFSDIAINSGIRDINKMIEKYRLIIARDFIEGKNGCIFNGNTYGVYNIYTTRHGESEKSAFKLKVYNTDYFTHKVFGAIYKELSQENHPIASASKSDILSGKYNAFTTSFGVNTFLIVDGLKGNDIIFSQRSNIATNEFTNKVYHVTMNEGLSQTDFDEFTNEVSLEQCLYRGLREEIGIHDKHRKYMSEPKFCDLFLDRGRFEIGITSYIKIEETFEGFIKNLIAKDRELEIDAFMPIEFSKKGLENFISTNDMIPHGLYTLKMVSAREEIYLNKIKKVKN